MGHKHTATPWTCFDVSEGKKEKFSIVHSGPIAYVGENARANASFIVRACNAHDELIEGLKRSIEIIRNYKAQYEPFEDDENYFKDMETLLNGAEGREAWTMPEGYNK